MQVDLNCDMGESFGAYSIGSDEEMMQYITSANVACGFHGGDPMVMDRTVRLAVANGVQVGCHPGYPDLAGFGRRLMGLTPDEVEKYVLYQLGALWAFARANGTEVRHAKAHGALGNVASEKLEVAQAVARGIAAFSKDVIMVCIAGTKLVDAGKDLGLRVAEEVFADRGYNADGTLQSRRMPGSVIHDPQLAVARAVQMVCEGTVVAHTGEVVRLRVDSICVHGDNLAAPRIAAALVSALHTASVKVQPMAEFI